MSEHTPGPWSTAKARIPTDGEYDFAIGAIIDGKKYCIAEAFGRVSEGHRTPAYANARLIAAAPELLAALQAVIGLERDADGLLGLTPINVRRAERAIAKAIYGEAQSK